MVTSLRLSIFGLRREQRRQAPSPLPLPTTKQRILWEVRVWTQGWSFQALRSLQESHAGASFLSSVWFWYTFSIPSLIHHPTDTPNSTCPKRTSSRMSSSLVTNLSWQLDEVLLYSTQKPGCLPPPYTRVTCQISLPNLCLSPTSGHPVLVCVTLHLYFCKCFLVVFPCPGSLPLPLPILCPALTLPPITHISTRRISWGEKNVIRLHPASYSSEASKCFPKKDQAS